MSTQFRNWFFDPTNPDRFKNYDIPTQNTFQNWSDSAAFIKEVGDRAQLLRAGLAKTTTDEKVNNRIDTDSNGISPDGFTTFVRPSQIFKIIAGANISLTEVVRTPGSDPDGETGGAIKDIEIAVDGFDIPSNTDDILYGDVSLDWDDLSNPFPYTIVNVEVVNTNTSTEVFQAMAATLTSLSNKLNATADALAALQSSIGDGYVEVGDMVMTHAAPSSWGANWMEPRGQALNIADYPDLFAKINDTYGDGGFPGTKFQLPNLSEDAYLRGVQSTDANVGLITGLADYSLTVANIPQHTHDFSGTVDSNGDHTHDILTSESISGNNTVDGSGNTAGVNTDTQAIQTAGAHTHTFSGTTDPWGTGLVTAIPLTPRAHNVYLKMRVK